MNFQEYVLKPAEDAFAGKETGIPTGLKVYSQVVNNIQQRVYTLVGGQSGGGKTAMVDLLYVFVPYIWYMRNKDKTDIKLKIVYRSMERNKKYKYQKWTCLLMLFRHGILMDIPTLNGWPGKKFNLSRKLLDKIKDCELFMDEMLTGGVIDLIDGAENPTGVYHNLVEHARKLGTEEIKPVTDKEGKVIYKEHHYTPNNSNLYFIPIIDHIGKVTSERRDGKYMQKKEIIDKLSEYMGICRDRYGMSPVLISQFNRSLSDSQRMRNKVLAPEPEDFKDSGNTYEDCDVCVALYNPYKLKDFNHLDYDIKKFVDQRTGENRFRTITVLKNTYGVDDVSIPVNFVGECGFMRQLKEPLAITTADYSRWVDNPLITETDDKYLIELLKQK